MTTSTKRRAATSVAALAVAGLALTACSGGPGVQDSSGGPSDNKVTIYGTIVDAEAELLEESWAGWAEENGIEIVYEGSKEFETQISVRAQGGTPPDIAIFPQPGLMGDLASGGLLTEAPEGVVSNLEQYWSEDWKTYSSYDGTVYGAPLMANLKGFVWYSPKFFKDNGYEVPKTWEELITLTGEIQAKTGTAPWCAGFGSDAATGWPGTDWIEDLVIRQQGPEVYDQWVANEIPFTDPRIQAAFDEAGKILTNPDYVNAGFGDVRSINSTAFGDPAAKLVDGTCALHHQASFYDGFITEAGGTVGEDGDVWAFMTPPVEGKELAVTGGGEIVGSFNADEDTVKVQEYLSSPEWANSRVSLGGVISANTGLDPASASSPILQESIAILQDPATTFRFDGSDLMPSAVGAGTFWKGIIDWINGTDVNTVTTQIESGWPSS